MDIQGGGGTQYTGVFDIEELEDGSVIGCGNKPIYKGDSTMISGWIIKLDSSGNVVWDREYTGLNAESVWNFLYDIDVLPDGGIIACGESQIPNQGQHGWILRLDSNGCEVENCVVGIDELMKEKKGEVKIYPNPARDYVTIEYAGFENDGLVEIVDVYGRIITTNQTIADKTRVEINTSGFSSGLYIVRVIGNNTMKEKGRFNIMK